jgi:hypothetical protein
MDLPRFTSTLMNSGKLLFYQAAGNGLGADLGQRREGGGERHVWRKGGERVEGTWDVGPDRDSMGMRVAVSGFMRVLSTSENKSLLCLAKHIAGRQAWQQEPAHGVSLADISRTRIMQKIACAAFFRR